MPKSLAVAGCALVLSGPSIPASAPWTARHEGRATIPSYLEMLPVPVQRASAHARFFDRAGPFGPCDGASETCCLPRSKQRRHPGIRFRGSMAGAYALPYRRFVAVLTDARARRGLLRRSGITPHTPCRSPGALRILSPQPASPTRKKYAQHARELASASIQRKAPPSYEGGA